jgi:hypothetical protein
LLAFFKTTKTTSHTNNNIQFKSDKMSAIADNTDGPNEKVKVLFALYPNYNTLDVAGPLEVLSRSLHDPKDKGECTLLDNFYHIIVQSIAMITSC